jgi:hypothetical protein
MGLSGIWTRFPFCITEAERIELSALLSAKDEFVRY